MRKAGCIFFSFCKSTQKCRFYRFFFRTCESKSDLTPIFLQIYEENMLRHENILKFVAADNLGWTPFLINNFKYLKL